MSNHEDVRAQIVSRLERLRTLDKLAEEMPSARRGNGWDASKITETVVRILPQPLGKLAKKAVRRGIARGIADSLRPIHSTKLAWDPTLVYLPLWHVRGYHECFYLREANYKVRVDRDVVAVDVDGETRDLMIEETESKIMPETFRHRLRRFSRLLTGEKKYFCLNDVIELAVRYKRAEMYLSADGREGEVLEEILPGNWKTQRVFDVADLNVDGATAKVAVSKENKESVMRRFREKVVKMPEASRLVLSNTFHVDELAQYYVPYVDFPVMRGETVDHVIMSAASSAIADQKDANFVLRQLSS